MPVGGIAEQVVDGKTGVLAASVDAEALAAAIRRLATDAALYGRISAHLSDTAEQRSMRTFMEKLLAGL
jgi:glycosyltransferase involved in cell wall biosynthesis